MKMIKISLCALVAVATQAGAASSILTGNFLKVGVNDSGGLIDSAFNVGIGFDKTGSANFPPPSYAYDFLKPGTPFEFYAVGYNYSSTANGYHYGNNVGGVTTDTSAGSTKSTRTTGSFGNLSILQNLSFNINSGFIDFDVVLKNTGPVAINNVVYARGLDPDQDVYAGGPYSTKNVIASSDLVYGYGAVSDWTIGIYSSSPYAHTPTIRSYWPYGDPYGLLSPVNDGDGDYAINMAWNIGTLGVGESADIKFQYRIAETRVIVSNVPDSSSTLGLLSFGLLGLNWLRRKF